MGSFKCFIDYKIDSLLVHPFGKRGHNTTKFGVCTCLRLRDKRGGGVTRRTARQRDHSHRKDHGKQNHEAGDDPHTNTYGIPRANILQVAFALDEESGCRQASEQHESYHEAI